MAQTKKPPEIMYETEKKRLLMGFREPVFVCEKLKSIQSHQKRNGDDNIYHFNDFVYGAVILSCRKKKRIHYCDLKCVIMQVEFLKIKITKRILHV